MHFFCIGIHEKKTQTEGKDISHTKIYNIHVTSIYIYKKIIIMNTKHNTSKNINKYRIH